MAPALETHLDGGYLDFQAPVPDLEFEYLARLYAQFVAQGLGNDDAARGIDGSPHGTIRPSRLPPGYLKSTRHGQDRSALSASLAVSYWCLRRLTFMRTHYRCAKCRQQVDETSQIDGAEDIGQGQQAG